MEIEGFHDTIKQKQILGTLILADSFTDSINSIPGKYQQVMVNCQGYIQVFLFASASVSLMVYIIKR